VIDAYNETSMTTLQLDARELDATKRKTRIIDVHIHTETIADEGGGAAGDARLEPYPEAGYEDQRDDGGDHPCPPLAEEPQHRDEIMPCLNRDA
jgi:hypothetical protein